MVIIFQTMQQNPTYFVVGAQDNSGNTVAGYAQDITISSNTTTTTTLQPESLYFPYQASTGVQGQENSLAFSVESSAVPTTDVYYQLSVENASTSIPLTSGVSAAIQSYSSTTSTSIDFSMQNGKWEAAQSSPVPYTNGNPANGTGNYLNITVNTPGDYKVTLNVIDPSGDTVATGIADLVVASPDVTGEVFAADGKTPVAWDQLVVEGPSGQRIIQSNNDGSLSTYLPAGTWTVTSATHFDNQGNEYFQTISGTQFTTVPGQTTTVDVTDPYLNLAGTAYVDPSHTVPLEYGGIGITGTSGTNWIPTNKNGNFATHLPSGDYTITQLAGSNTYDSLSIPVTIGSSPSTLTVSPPSPDFSFPVKDESGQPVTSGTVGVTTLQDYQAGNYTSVQSFSISSGDVSGDLPAGSYVAFYVSGHDNSFPVHTQFAITNTSTVASGITIEPPQATFHGILEDSSGKPIPYGTIVVQEVSGGQPPGESVTLFTDANGGFTNIGWNAQGQLASVIDLSKSYVVTGVGNGENWWQEDIPLNLTSGSVTVQLPSPDLSGTVQVDGSTVQSGWVYFTSASGNGDTWIPAQINSGSYSATLPSGTYEVAGIQDNSTGAFYDEQNNAGIGSATIQSTSSSNTFNVVATDNLTGTVTNASGGVGYATVELSPVPDPTTQQQWDSVLYAQTGPNGKFALSLPTTGTWYVVDVTYPDGSSGYQSVQLSQPITVPSSSITVSVNPNTDVAVSWPGGPLQANTQAWLYVQDSNGHTYEAMNSPTSASTFDFTLPTTGTYTILGMSVQGGNGAQTWTDLSYSSQTITGGSLSNTITVDGWHSGTVSGLTTTDYTGSILFQSTANSSVYESVPVTSSGTFSTTLTSSGWTVAGFEDASGYTLASSSTYSTSSGTWNVVLK